MLFSRSKVTPKQLTTPSVAFFSIISGQPDPSLGCPRISFQPVREFSSMAVRHSFFLSMNFRKGLALVIAIDFRRDLFYYYYHAGSGVGKVFQEGAGGA